jgi:hypothetical protein
MQMLGRRALSTKAFTVINPSKYSLGSFLSHSSLRPHVSLENFASELVVASPQHADELASYVTNCTGNDNGRQVIGLVSDSVPLGGQRNGFSFLLSSERFKLSDAIELDKKLEHSDNTARRNPRGLYVGITNWAPSNSFFSLEIGNSTSLILPIANTLFNNGKEATMLYNSLGEQLSGRFLTSLKASLPVNQSPDPSFYAPLAPVQTEKLTITSCKDNMVKLVNDKAAASYLENAEELKQGDASTQISRKVFAFVQSPNDSHPRRYQVIAGGGGGWSPRATMLVLEPHASPKKGDSITFSYTISEDRDFRNDLPNIQTSQSLQIIFEACKKLESLNENTQILYPSDYVLENTFGAGSEEGFLLNEHKYAVENELVILK